MSAEHPHTHADEEKETGRVEAFSDGVIAIAITLLALELRVPHIEGESGLLAALGTQWPSYLAFFTSFLNILIMWINHHRMFTLIRRIDSAFLIFNGLLLMGMTIVPFPTALFAEYIRHPEAKVAAGVYTGIFFVIALLFQVVWRYAAHDMRLMGRGVSPELVRSITQQYNFGPIFYFVAFVASFFSAALGFGICLALAIYFALPAKLVLRMTGRE